MHRRMILDFTWAIGLMCTLVGCGSLLPESPILKANFEKDVVGTKPTSDIPDDPDGDAIHLYGSKSGSAIVIAAPAGLSGKSLSYRHSPGPAYARYVLFIGKEISPSVDQVWATWEAVPQIVDGVPLDVWIGNSNFGRIGQIRFLNGQVFVRENDSEDSFTPIQNGTFRNGVLHQIVIRVDKKNSTYQFLMLGGGGSSPWGTDRLPVLSSRVLATTQPTITFHFSSEGTSTSTYAIDDVRITAK